jgi:hypothetical protein
MKHCGDLTLPVQRLVAALYRGNGERAGGMWIVSSVPDARFQPQTVNAAYDRCLVKITVESRHRRRHTLTLTEIGRHVALALEAKATIPLAPFAAILRQEIVEAA